MMGNLIINNIAPLPASLKIHNLKIEISIPSSKSRLTIDCLDSLLGKLTVDMWEIKVNT